MENTGTFNTPITPVTLSTDYSLEKNCLNSSMDGRRVTVLVYHYVRNLTNSRYPAIKGLDLEQFKLQIDYLADNYTFITIEQLIQAIKEGDPLPSKAVLLTFNDCYSDHFTNVFPLLDERGIQGCFYPEIAAFKEQKVLSNHKIHFILASAENSQQIKDQIFLGLDKLRNEYQLQSNEYYYQKLAKPSEYDNEETVFVKRILQNELLEEPRKKLTDQLFDRFVGVNEKVFSRELYLNEKQAQCMINHGMHFGILGYRHKRYDSLNKETQKEEITRARDFLINLGISEYCLTASYPWGAYNKETLEIMDEINCKVAFTSHTDIADLNSHSRLELPRLDTNELPKYKDAEPNHWFAEA